MTLGRRDAVRMLVSIGEQPPRPSIARDLAQWLDEGDLVVVNTSATIPAAIDATTPDGRAVVVHLSTELPTDAAPGRDPPAERRRHDGAGPRRVRRRRRCTWPAAARVRVLGRMPRSVRLWVATLALPVPLLEHLDRWGRPIRYRYVPDSWPLHAYTNAFAREPGSAEMPSAGRVLTPEVVTDLVAHGIVVAPIVLHTGVASLEAHETPYPERYRVPAATARLVNATRAAGGRVVAVGTTVVRALETVADDDGVVHPGAGGPSSSSRPSAASRVVDGLLTGWHEPEASHLRMLEAVAGRRALELAYARGARGRVPMARVRRRPPDPAGAMMSPIDAARRQRAPPVSAAQRSVLYAVRRRGEATVADVAEMLDMTPSGARQHLTGLADAGLLRGRRGGPRPGPAGPQRAGLLHRPGRRAAVPAGLRRADQPAARLRPRRRRRRRRSSTGATTASRAPGPGWPGKRLRRQGRRAGQDPRRGRLPGLRRAARRRRRSASPSATAPSSPSPASTPRPARPSSSSSAPPCPRPTIERVTPHDGRRPRLQLRGPPRADSERCRVTSGVRHAALVQQHSGGHSDDVSRAGSWGPRW